MSGPNMLDAALGYARHGLYVLPLWWPQHDFTMVCACGDAACKSVGKHPRIKVGSDLREASIDEKQITKWWNKWPLANIGIALEPSELIAFDVDKPEGYATLEAVERDHDLPPTPRQKSGSGNLHVVTRKPAHSIRGDYGGITMRGKNYIAAAPSLHESGGRYEWFAGLAPWETAPIALPVALAEKLKRYVATTPAKTSTALIDSEVQVKRARPWVAKAEPAIEGSHGESKLFVVCCKLVHGFKLSDADALAVILSEFNPRCVPPWGDDELDEVRRKITEAREKCDNPAAFAVEDRPRQKKRERVPDDGVPPPTDDDAPQLDRRRRSEPSRSPAERLPFTELGNAKRFAAAHDGRLRYVHAWARWLSWDGRRWHRDDIGAEMRAAKAVVDALYSESAEAAALAARGDQQAGPRAKALLAWAVMSSKASAHRAMVMLAQSETNLVATANMFDRDPMLLNVLNGTINLRTGTLRPHNPADMITMIAPVEFDPGATCPLFDAFLSRALPDEGVRRWTTRFFGYSITGDVGEHQLAFAYGDGANGKSTFLEVLMRVLGDYATGAAPELLLAKRNESHPTEVADLEGKRLVVVQEIDSGKHWAEATIKRLTGGDTIKARRMKQDFYAFTPTHKLVIAANTKPRVLGTDEAIWRRLRLVPFEVTIPENERDKGLVAKLVKESAGILALLVRACLEWRDVGLGASATIEQATSAYRADEDVLGRWIGEECVLHASAFASTTKLYEAFIAWCERTGEARCTRDELRARLLTREGIASVVRNHGTVRGLAGIGLRSERAQLEIVR